MVSRPGDHSGNDGVNVMATNVMATNVMVTNVMATNVMATNVMPVVRGARC